MAVYPQIAHNTNHTIKTLHTTVSSLTLFKLMAAAINGSCLALMDAGISLSATIAAVTCAITQDGSLLLDPTLKEEQVGLWPAVYT